MFCSENVITAVTEMIEYYKEGGRALINFAQMQSGKTNAFLLLAGEMLRIKLVKNVVIFTGNRERELKSQLTEQVRGNQSFYDTKYVNFVSQNTNILQGLNIAESFAHVNELITNIKSKITIVWGTELMKKARTIQTKNTLFIFEESHFAQTIGQTPEKFMNAIGLPANGDIEVLQAKNNYLCSVSATPFSELCDNGNFEQQKKVIRMKPDQNYRGVEWLKYNNKLIGFSNWQTTLRNALILKKNECNWAIIRVRGEDQFEKARVISLFEGWDIRQYDQTSSDIESMKELENKPTKPTIVILKEKCRMGTVVPKTNLAFVFETSNRSNTDTLLQSLLGRSCGYHNNNTLLVYLHQDILASRELNTYIQFCEGNDNSVPTKAKNVVVETNNDAKTINISSLNIKLTPTIPIYIPYIDREVENTLNSRYENKAEKLEALVDGIIYAIDNNGAINENPNKITELIKNELENLKHNNGKFNNLNLCKSNGERNKSYITQFEKVLEGIKHKKAVKVSKKINTRDKDNETIYNITLFKVNKMIENLIFGSYYLCCNLNLTDEQIELINSQKIITLPKTNGREIFRYNMETGEERFGNGGYCLGLNPETATNEDLMLQTIRECVLRSKETQTVLLNPRSINSIHQPGFEKYSGIFLSSEIYKSLMIGGNIYNEIKNELNVEIKCTKSRGRKPTMPDGCSYRIAEISW